MMHDRIEINPRIRNGEPVIKGTRVPVARLVAELADGTSVDEIATQYEVTIEDIRAAAEFAVEQQTGH